MEKCRHLGGCQGRTLFRKVNTRVEDISLNCKLPGFGGSSWTRRPSGPAGSTWHVVAEGDPDLRTPGACRHLATKLSCCFSGWALTLHRNPRESCGDRAGLRQRCLRGQALIRVFLWSHLLGAVIFFKRDNFDNFN